METKRDLSTAPPVPSDILADIRPLFQAYPQLAVTLDVFQLHVVIDANVILAELMWIAGRRESQDGRTMLQEVLASGTIVAVAPTYLDSEIQEHLPRISEERDIPLEALQAAWADYRQTLDFRPDPEIPEELKTASPDPDDLPYAVLSNQLGYVVLSNDCHLHQMGSAVRTAIVVHLRDYSRLAAVEFTFVFGNAVITSVGLAVVVGVWRALQAGWGFFRRLPTEAQVLLVGLMTVAALHPKTRALIRRYVSAIAQGGGALITEALAPLLDALPEAQAGAKEALEKARAELPDAASA